MKLTASQLRQIIKEELHIIAEANWPQDKDEAGSLDDAGAQQRRIEAIKSAYKSIGRLLEAAERGAGVQAGGLENKWYGIYDLMETLKFGSHPADIGWFRLEKEFEDAITSAQRGNGFKVRAGEILKTHWNSLRKSILEGE